jgi:hypothetical protein
MTTPVWILAIALCFVWHIYRRRTKELKRAIFNLEQEVWTLQHFICEAPAFKDSAEEFGKRRFVEHNTLKSRSCICHIFEQRAAVLRDYNSFWETNSEALIKSYEFADDDSLGEAEYELTRTRQQLAMKQQYLPLLVRLSKLLPKKMTNSHVKWITRRGIDLKDFGAFCLWFLVQERPWNEELPEEIKSALKDLADALEIPQGAR